MRIDQLNPGDKVILGFCSNDRDIAYTEPAVFVRMLFPDSLDLTQRRAEFRSAADNSTLPYEYLWQAYRYNGHWAYGTSAQGLKLVSVQIVEEVQEEPISYVDEQGARLNALKFMN